MKTIIAKSEILFNGVKAEIVTTEERKDVVYQSGRFGYKKVKNEKRLESRVFINGEYVQTVSIFIPGQSKAAQLKRVTLRNQYNIEILN
jgi:hypothetical protein